MSKGVIGLGNPYRGDDAISLVLIHELEMLNLPYDIVFHDIGASGMKILHLLKKLDRVVIVDAILFDGYPGEFVFFKPPEVKSLKELGGTHSPNLLESLSISRKLGEVPEKVLIMGIQPKNTEIGDGLSEELRSKLPVLLEALKEKIVSL